MMKSHSLPPFSGLRAFEAASRYLNFSLAAEELNVTQSAISHQIKSLEEFLGLSLFERNHRSLRLSKSGQAYLPSIRTAIEMISNASEQIANRQETENITISLLPSFATRWLIPRLPDFQSCYPDIDVRLSTSVSVIDFNNTDVDVAIRYGKGDWQGLYQELLISEEIFPVCSPSLLKEKRKVKKPDELANYTLLHNLSHPGEWAMWLTAMGLDKIDPKRGHGFESSDLALLAAIEGMGMALGRSPLVDEALESGHLVAPLPVEMSSEYNYYFVCPEVNLKKNNIKLFYDWLFEQVNLNS